MNVLDLFSGIGGFSLGLERAGMRTVAFCEIDPYCRRVLAKHWPTVPVFGDVRELTAASLADAGIGRCRAASERQDQQSRRAETIGTGVDLICGGFPCQDISTAGKGAGIGGARSGLWSEYARIIGEVRPRYAIVENVAALLGRGLERVLGDLAALGYDAEWHCIPASAVGAPHRRDRVWIVAYPNGEPLRGNGHTGAARPQGGMQGEAEQRQRLWPDAATGGGGPDVAYAAGGTRQRQTSRQNGHSAFGSEDVPDANGAGREQQRWGVPVRAQLAAAECAGWWRAEPDVGRVAHGISARVDRLRSLGNAVVPQIPEIIGRAIMSLT